MDGPTWIIVHHEPSSLSSLVSPQIPMILESSAAHATSLFKESGVTVYPEASVDVSHETILMLTVSASTVKMYS